MVSPTAQLFHKGFLARPKGSCSLFKEIWAELPSCSWLCLLQAPLRSLLREGVGYLFTWAEINFFLGFGNSWKHQLFQTKFRINNEIPSISVLQVKEKLNKNKMFQKYTHIKAHRFCYNAVFSSKTLVADCLPVASQNRLHEFLFLHFRILTPLVLVRLNNSFPTTQMNYIQGIGFRMLGLVPQKQNLMCGIRVSLTFLYLCSFI